MMSVPENRVAPLSASRSEMNLKSECWGNLQNGDEITQRLCGTQVCGGELQEPERKGV